MSNNTDVKHPNMGKRQHRGSVNRGGTDYGAGTVEVAELDGADLGGRLLHVRQTHEALGEWWQNNARDLPWRFGRTSPWGVLVSEVMSQQTQMSRVVPYWQMWMEQWPDPQSLSQATTAEVLTAWGKLGYPRRALRLQECAQVLCQTRGGQLPTTYDELVALPGIGDYTASAILSFAFGKRIAVVDTNIRRVLSRVFLGTESLGGSATKQERTLARAVLPHDTQTDTSLQQQDNIMDCNISDPVVKATAAEHSQFSPQAPWKKPSVVWNQAVMELGATVCTAKAPQCDACPLRQYCEFYDAGLPNLGQQRTRPRQKFKGTDRQVRGIVLDALRKLPHDAVLTRQEVERLWDNHFQLDECIVSLDNDGLIEILPHGAISFPHA